MGPKRRERRSGGGRGKVEGEGGAEEEERKRKRREFHDAQTPLCVSCVWRNEDKESRE